MAEKPHVNLVFIGHVDHGKSTLIGRMLVEKGLISEKELQEEAGSFKFAWVMDREREERERGVTIDVAYQKFETPKNMITIIDAPGHRDFIKNMITGASQADAAVLVVAADDGVMPQTREHAALAFTLGVDQLIVVVNKMDLVEYKQGVYEQIKADVRNLLSSIGYKNVDQIPFIPISAFFGEGISRRSDKLLWYKGPIFVEALEGLREPPKPVDKPLRIPIQDVYSITGVGTVPIGRVETGVLKVGDVVVFEPAGTTGEVRSIEMHHEPIQRAEPGDNIGFNVRGVGKEQIRRGDVAGHPDSPPSVAREFTAKIVVLASPGEIGPGFSPTIHCHAAHVPGQIVQLVQKIDPKTGGVVEENPRSIKRGDAAVIRVFLLKPLVIERASDLPQLSRFAIRHAGQTIAAGICSDLKPARS